MVEKSIFNKLNGKIERLPALSQVVTEVLKQINRGDVELSTLMAHIGKDQALAAHLLRVVNSPFYGYSQHISSLKEAGMMLGIHTIRNLVMSASVMAYFPPEQDEAFSRIKFWEHSIGNAVIAKVLARHCGIDEEMAFTAGLLHDIGKLVLASFFEDEFSQVLDYRDKHDCLLKDAEKKVLGYDHCALGGKVAEKWKLPREIVDAIKYHHKPEENSEGSVADLIHISDIVCRSLEIGDGGDSLIPCLVPAAMQRLGLDWEGLRDNLPEIERLNASSSILLEGVSA